MPDHKDFFYKYYNYDGLLATLKHGARLWTYASSLPEPLAADIKIKWEFGGFQEIIVACMRKQDHAGRTNLNINFQKFLDKMTAGTLQPDKFVRDLKESFNLQSAALRPQTLLCCFSQNRHNLPMWFTYAENHRGGLIKFGNLEKTNSPLQAAAPVSYQNERPKYKLVRAIEANDNHCIWGALRQTLLTKARDWQHEAEWRVINLETPAESPEAIAPQAEMLTRGSKLLPFAREEVTAVYLGADMPAAHRTKIMELVTEYYPWAEIYQAHQQAKGLTLDFSLIKSWQHELPL